MNKEYYRLDDNTYIITNEKGKMRILESKKDEQDVENLLLKENELEETTEKIEKCNENIKNTKSNAKARKITTILSISLVILLNVLLKENIINIIQTKQLITFIIGQLIIITSIYLLPIMAHGKNHKKKLATFNEQKTELEKEIEQIKKDIEELKMKPDITTTHRQTIKPIARYNHSPQEPYTKKKTKCNDNNHN